jgi:hypothetical protein
MRSSLVMGAGLAVSLLLGAGCGERYSPELEHESDCMSPRYFCGPVRILEGPGVPLSSFLRMRIQANGVWRPWESIGPYTPTLLREKTATRIEAQAYQGVSIEGIGSADLLDKDGGLINPVTILLSVPPPKQ